MNPTIAKKLSSTTLSLSKGDIAAHVKNSVRELSYFKESISFVRKDLEKALAVSDADSVKGRVLDTVISLRALLSDDLSPCRAAASDQHKTAWMANTRNLSQLYALHDLIRKMGGGIRPLAHSALPQLLLGLQAIGWSAEAREYCEYAWTHDANAMAEDLIPEELFAWFSIYFTLGSRDLIAPTGIKEPDKPDSVYSMLLGKWKNPDPAEVSNTLLAYAERNVAETLLPQSKRPLDLERPDLLFIPYDVLAINMRRHAEGLAWVDIDDPRMEGWPVCTEKMPLVKDNVTWPIYVELCKLVGVEPMRAEKEIEVTVDPETLEIMAD